MRFDTELTKPSDTSVSLGFADASVAPIDFTIAPAAAMPKVLDC